MRNLRYVGAFVIGLAATVSAAQSRAEEAAQPLETGQVTATTSQSDSPAVRGSARTFRLADDPLSRQTWTIVAEVTGEGQFQFQPPEAAASPVTHPASVKASFHFEERRLLPSGREEAAFRALRRYHEAVSTIRVGGQTSVPALRNSRSQIVARATRQGVSTYSPDGPLTATELEILPFPGDPLLLAALLPGREVSVGETWTPDSWIGPAMAAAEVSLNAKMSCKLESVREGLATLRFEGTIEGATKGATSETRLAGTVTYHLQLATITSAEVTHTEKRSIGPLAPGMELTLTTHLRRAAAATEDAIGDAETASVPLEPPAEALRVEYPAQFGVTLACDRDWKIFHQTSQLLILRLLDHGGLIAQCNLAPAPRVQAGGRTPETQFQQDIRRSLGEQLTEIVAAEELVGFENSIYRVIAAGKVKNVDRLWRYYLITAPDGRQASFVFTLDPADQRRLGNRDLDLVGSLRFVEEEAPTPARP
jgi:hypothetical protein